MTLPELLNSLNDTNIRQLTFLFKYAKCSTCREIYQGLCEGKNIFDLLRERVDYIGRAILNQNNVECLNILGDYLTYTKKFRQSLKRALYYPFYILVGTNGLFLAMKYLLGLSNRLLLVQLTILPMVYLLYSMCIKLYKKHLNLLALKLLMHNSIGFKEFSELTGCRDPANMYTHVLGYTCLCTEEIDIIYKNFRMDMDYKVNFYCSLLNNFILVVASITVLITFYEGFSRFNGYIAGHMC